MLKLEDLYVGRRVCWEELQDIHDVYIYLKNCSGGMWDLSGEFVCAVKERNSYTTSLILSGCRCVYNDSMDFDEDVAFDG